jgi:RND family efflux transporter MFP subunit
MRELKLIAVLSMIAFLYACGPQDKRAQLGRLESKKDAITEQIEKLKGEIGEETGTEQPLTKMMYVNISPVKQGLFQHFIKIQGTIESDNNILIPPSSSGIVKKIHVQAGDRARKGQLLAELDASILESSIEELKSGLSLARTIFERQERLWNKNIGSEIEYLQAKNNKENLEKKLKTLNEQYKLTKITSPLAGTVDEVLIKEGEMASAGYGAIRVVQLSNLKIEADLSENYIARIKKKDVVHIQIPALNRGFEHRIEAVSQVIDPKNRTFRIKIKVPAQEKMVKPNMLAILTINDYSNPEALVVPGKIVQKTGTEQFLFTATQENNTWVARKRIIKTGEEYGQKVEVRDGLQEDEYIVVFGYQNLADGQKISINITD